jgi:hypothetical protein
MLYFLLFGSPSSLVSLMTAAIGGSTPREGVEKQAPYNLG